MNKIYDVVLVFSLPSNSTHNWGQWIGLGVISYGNQFAIAINPKDCHLKPTRIGSSNGKGPRR